MIQQFKSNIIVKEILSVSTTHIHPELSLFAHWFVKSHLHHVGSANCQQHQHYSHHHHHLSSSLIVFFIIISYLSDSSRWTPNLPNEIWQIIYAFAGDEHIWLLAWRFAVLQCGDPSVSASSIQNMCCLSEIGRIQKLLIEIWTVNHARRPSFFELTMITSSAISWFETEITPYAKQRYQFLSSFLTQIPIEQINFLSLSSDYSRIVFETVTGIYCLEFPSILWAISRIIFVRQCDHQAFSSSSSSSVIIRSRCYHASKPIDLQALFKFLQAKLGIQFSFLYSV